MSPHSSMRCTNSTRQSERERLKGVHRKGMYRYDMVIRYRDIRIRQQLGGNGGSGTRDGDWWGPWKAIVEGFTYHDLFPEPDLLYPRCPQRLAVCTILKWGKKTKTIKVYLVTEKLSKARAFFSRGVAAS